MLCWYKHKNVYDVLLRKYITRKKKKKEHLRAILKLQCFYLQILKTNCFKSLVEQSVY